MTGRLPVVAIVGRPNVGKSTFFNRVIGRRVAIVDDRPGVTRDRNFARVDWAGRDFFIVDTRDIHGRIAVGCIKGDRFKLIVFVGALAFDPQTLPGFPQAALDRRQCRPVGPAKVDEIRFAPLIEVVVE